MTHFFLSSVTLAQPVISEPTLPTPIGDEMPVATPTTYLIVLGVVVGLLTLAFILSRILGTGRRRHSDDEILPVPFDPGRY
ncbi:hypothetical protein PB2503_07714 [Parvularcula bermudensis HTCC2503]|uniref:Uncharacterized protein n=1 Tax=Parvularcula bermudensis (strain ATCC BAA-594 / HTCC2503 / KCTC 12087) TaxID=314260 RepID=E0TGH9_PARBH|nr:hypothetical protein [Parvularcula bermudensis]ADM09598.1 hypothetical protein PB2503_07714 [Parvularcula bermudensis HTCC2503]